MISASAAASSGWVRAGRRRSHTNSTPLTTTPRTVNIHRCQPDASLRKLKAAPVLCRRMKSSTGSSVTDSNSAKCAVIRDLVH